MTDPAIIEAAARALYLSWFPDAPVDEHFQWYHDGAANPDSCVHESNVARALKDAAAVTPLIEAAALKRRTTTVVEGEMTPEILSWAESVLDAEAVRVIKAATLEKAAKVADDYYHPGAGSNPYAVQLDIAAAIRALKEQP